jgi:hypothetical protein
MPLRDGYRGPAVPHKHSGSKSSKLTDGARYQATLDMSFLLDLERLQESRALEDKVAALQSKVATLQAGKATRKRIPKFGEQAAGRSLGFVSSVAEHYQIDATSMRRLWKRRDTGTSAKERLGRPPKFTPTKQKRLVDEFNKVGGGSIRRLSTQMADTEDWDTNYRDFTRTGPTKETIRRALENGVVQVKAVRKRPMLSPENEGKRFTICKERIEKGTVSSTFDIDEAMVRQSMAGGAIALIPGDEVDENLLAEQDAAHGHPPQVLLTAIITKPVVLNAAEFENGAPPVFHPLWDGKAALIRHRSWRPRKKRRRDPETNEFIPLDEDEPMYENMTINAERYSELYCVQGGYADMISEYVAGVENRVRAKVIAIRQDFQSFDASMHRRKKLRGDVVATVQEDSAGGHGVKGRAHASLVGELDRRRINIVQQPPYSPETNMCDLGFWSMLKSRISERRKALPRYTGSNGSEIEAKIWEIAKEVWDNIEPRKLFNIAMQKERIFDAIVAKKGGMLEKEPHTGVRVMFGTGSPRRS